MIELFFPGMLQVERALFQNAMYAGAVTTATVDVVPLSSHKPLREFLKQAVRCAENRLREIAGYKGKLRGIELEEDIARLIVTYLDRALLQKAEAPKAITIDPKKLTRAALEAEETMRMLALGNTTPEDEEPPDTPQPPHQEILTRPSPVAVAGAPEGEGGEGEWCGLMRALSVKETALLCALSAGAGERALQAAAGGMPEPMF